MATRKAPLKVFVLSTKKGLSTALEKAAAKHQLPVEFVMDPALLTSATAAEPEMGRPHSVSQLGVDLQPDEAGLVNFQGAEVLVSSPAMLKKIAHQENVVGFGRSLKWIHSTTAGVEEMVDVMRRFEQQGVRVTRYGRGFGPLMAEWALGMILARERKLKLQFEAQEKSEWASLSMVDRNGKHSSKEMSAYRGLTNLSICIVGFGNIGRHVGQVCKAFGMRVIGANSSGTASDGIDGVCADEVVSVDNLTTVFPSCDYIFNLLPDTKATKGLLDRGQFEACDTSRNTVFMNAGRGTVVNEDTLVTSLEKGFLAGAILDVFHDEPLPKESKLWSRQDVVITPHVAAISLEDDICSIFCDNARRYLDDKPLLYEVDWHGRGY